jgi:ABC-type proline/glycine betaine transport system permease subunit
MAVSAVSFTVAAVSLVMAVMVAVSVGIVCKHSFSESLSSLVGQSLDSCEEHDALFP